MLNTAYGFQNLLKEGSKHYSGLEEAIYRNINACREISNMTKTSFGPNGAKKMVINYLEKIFVTSDAATIMKELEVAHPAAKLIVLATKMQESECGDGTNFVVTLAGELLNQAEGLLRMGLHPIQVVSGYEQALKKAIEFLEKHVYYQVKDIRNVDEVTRCLRSSVASKLQDTGDFFSRKIAEACIQTLPENSRNFDVEYIRVAKIHGASVSDSFVLKGLIVTRNVETPSINEVTNPKIAVYGCPLDTQAAETKGTVLIKNAEELINYNKSEEDHAHNFIKSIADAGVTCVVVGGTISDICLHYLEKYRIMTLRVTSKFELKRLCKAIQATALVRLGAPVPEELGTADSVQLREIGSQKVIVFERDSADCKLATIVLRGSTTNLMEDIERAIDDGVNAFKNLVKEPRFIAGAGASEIQLAQELDAYANTITTLDQYAFRQYAKAFEIFPRILAENAGQNADLILTKLYSNLSNNVVPGIDVDNGQVKNIEELDILDNLQTKIWAIRLASDAALTVLRVDQIIIAKPAGGPKPKQQTNWDEDP
jgi:T-complex protein 1 subunit theta